MLAPFTRNKKPATRIPRFLCWASCILFALAACTYRGSSGLDAYGEIDDPGVQKLSWFSFVNGDDIRRTCHSGAPDMYRLIYNGRYEEQVRVYEINQREDGSVFQAKIQRRLSLTNFSFADLLSPWRWVSEEKMISAKSQERLQQALARDDAFSPSPQGLWLDSRGFYWIAVGCHDGKVFFHAWQYPDEAFKALTFPDLLFRLDTTGVRVNPPRYIDPGERYRERLGSGEYSTYNFRLEVGENGLDDHSTLFP